MRREELGATFFGTLWGNGANCNKISRNTFHWECGWCGWTRAEFLSRECGIEYAMQSLPCRKCAEEGAEGAEEVQKKRCTGSGSEAWMAWADALKQNFTLQSFTMLEIVLIEWERLCWASILARGNHLQHLLLVIAMGTPNSPAPTVVWPLRSLLAVGMGPGELH